MPTIVCVSCRVFFKVEKNGVAFEEGFGDGRGQPYKLWLSDRYKCPSCGMTILAGLGREPVAEHFMSNYARLKQACRPELLVDDCPGGCIHPEEHSSP